MERSNPVSWKRSNQEEMNDDCSVISATTGGSLSPLLLPCIQRNGIASTTKHKKFNFPALHFSNVSPVIPLQCWSKTSDDDQEFSCMEMSGEEIINSSESSISATALLSAKQPKCLNELSEGPELEMSAQLIMVKENVSGKSNPKNSVESPLNSGWGEVTGTRNQRLSKSFEIFNELPTSSIPNHKDCYTDALTSGTCVGNTDSRTPEIQLSGKRQCLASPNQDLTLPQTVDGERHTLVHSGKKSSLPQTVDGEMTGSRHKFTLHQTVDGDRHTLAHTGQKSTLQIQEDVALTDLQPEKYPCKTCSQELERTSEVQHAPSLSVPESPQTQHSDPRRITGPASLSHCQIVDREMPEEQTLHQQQDHQYTGSDATLSPALVLPEQMSQNPSLNDSQNNTEEKRSQSQNNMGGKESPQNNTIVKHLNPHLSNLKKQSKEDHIVPISVDQSSCNGESVSSSLILIYPDKHFDSSPPFDETDTLQSRGGISPTKSARARKQTKRSFKNQVKNNLPNMPGSAILTIGDKEYDAAKSSNNAPNAIAQSKQKSLEGKVKKTKDIPQPRLLANCELASASHNSEQRDQEPMAVSQDSKTNKRDLSLLTHKKEEELLKLLINLYDKLSHKMQKGPCLEAEEQISKFEGILTRLKKNQEREQKKLSSSRKKHKHYSHEVHQTRLAWLAERKDLLTQASFKHTLIVKRLGNLRSSVGAKAAVSQTIQSCETVNLLTDRDASVGPEASETQPIQMEPDRGSTILAQKAETRKEGTVSGVDFNLPSDTLKSIVPSTQSVKKAHYKRSRASDEDLMQLSQSPDPHSSCAGKNIVFSDGSRELVVGGGEIAERRDNDRKRKLNPRDGTNENSSKYVGLTCDLFESQGKQHCLLTPYPKDVQNSAGNIDTLSSGLTNKDAVLPTVPTKFCSSNQEDINLEMSRDCPQQIDEVDTYFELFTGVTIRGSAMENHIMTGQSAVCKDNSVKVTAKCSANPASYQFHQVQKNTQSQAENSNKVSVSGSVINLLDNEAHGESPAYMLSEREDSSYPANAIERNACDVRPMIGTKVDFMKPVKTNISLTDCGLNIISCLKPHQTPIVGKRKTVISNTEAYCVSGFNTVSMNSENTIAEPASSVSNVKTQTPAVISQQQTSLNPKSISTLPETSTSLMLQESLHKFPSIPEKKKCTRPKTNAQEKPQADLHDISPLADTGDSTSVIGNTKTKKSPIMHDSVYKPAPASPCSSASSCLFSICRNYSEGRKSLLNQNQPIANSLADPKSITSTNRQLESCQDVSRCSSLPIVHATSSTASSNTVTIPTEEQAVIVASRNKNILLSSIPCTQQSQNVCTGVVAASSHMSKDFCGSQLKKQIEGRSEKVKLGIIDTRTLSKSGTCQTRIMPAECVTSQTLTQNILPKNIKASFVPPKTTISLPSSSKCLNGAYFPVPNHVRVQYSTQAKLPMQPDLTSKTKLTPSCPLSEGLKQATFTNTPVKKRKRATGGKRKKSQDNAVVNQGHIDDFFSKPSPANTSACAQVKEPELSKDALKTGVDKNTSNQNVSISSNYNKGSFTSASGLQEHDFPSTAMLHKIKNASSTRDGCLENSSMIQTEEKQKSAILDCTSKQIWLEFKSVHMIHDSELSSGSLEFVDFWSERFSDIRMTEAFWDSVDTW